ncbi:MAG: MlaD family protein [Planctomycetota bacterium]|nr:MlaD family protein [Planctomycetota bacterium]
MPEADAPSEHDVKAIPHATYRNERRISLAWIIPLVALFLASGMGWRAWQTRGVIITVRLPEGHSLKPGDEVRYKGITIGEIRDITLTNDLQGILITARLRQEAERIARSGSRFWVVRPQLRLTSVEGLETLIGPRYLAALPGHEQSLPWRDFIGLSDPPVVAEMIPGDLEVVVEAETKGTLRPGTPITYRQIPIGSVLSVGLASDGGGIEARLHIQKAYTSLIREHTRFWDAGGFQANVGLTGFSIKVESLEAALQGSIAIATPPEDLAGENVRTGHRYILHKEPKKDWLEWKPLIAIGNSLLPPGAPMPTPLRARIGWTQGRILRNQETRYGWVLQTDQGLLGPANLLKPDEKADRETVVLEVEGVIIPLNDEPRWTDGVLTLYTESVTPYQWLSSLISHPAQPMDCIVISDPALDPLPLAASRLHDQGQHWDVDQSLSIDPSWHGAAVVSRENGHVVGLLIVDDSSARVALLPDTIK